MVRAARYAMGTRFEVVLYGERPGYLKAAAEEALNEIARLDAQLSFYRNDSDITDLNQRAAYEAVPVDPRLFTLLARAAELSEQTDGAFDITIAPLLRCWGFVGATGRMPMDSEVDDALTLTGMHHVVLDAANFTVRFDRQGVMLDLGAIGKGYAVDQAVELLRENGIISALLHGGTSSVYAIGAPPDTAGWSVALQRPFASPDAPPLTILTLRDAALSVSAPHGKWFQSEGRRYGHVIDPRTGRPASRSLLAATLTDAATDGDALSTALLVLGADWLPEFVQLKPSAGAIVVTEGADGAEAIIQSNGL
jgi:thiamine biosynthesis lipoprotein